MKRKSLILTLTILFVAGMAFAAGMQGAPQGMQKKGDMKGGQCQLLTDDEKIKVGDAKRDFEKAAIPLRAQIKVLRIEMDEMIQAGQSVKDISRKLEEMNDVEAKLAEAKLEHQVAIRQIVGADKYRKMHQLNEPQMMKKPHHKMGENHQGAFKGQGRECPYRNEAGK